MEVPEQGFLQVRWKGSTFSWRWVVLDVLASGYLSPLAEPCFADASRLRRLWGGLPNDETNRRGNLPLDRLDRSPNVGQHDNASVQRRTPLHHHHRTTHTTNTTHVPLMPLMPLTPLTPHTPLTPIAPIAPLTQQLTPPHITIHCILFRSWKNLTMAALKE